MAGVFPATVPRASVQLWDQFEALNQKLAQGLLICRDFSDLLTRRAALDEEYANKLQAFAKGLLGGAISSWFTSAPKEPPIAKEHTYGTLLKIALERPQAVAADQSSFLLEFVAKIRNEIVKPLTTFTTAKDTRRKEIAPEAQKWLRNLQDAKDDVLLKRSNFHKTMQMVDAAAEALEKEDMKMGYRDDKVIKGLEQKLEQAQEKGKPAEKEYMDAVDLANQIARDVYQSHLPPLLDELQHIEFLRQGTLVGALNVLAGLQDSYAPYLQEKFGDMSAIIKRQSMEKDWTEWAATAASKNTDMDNIVTFEPYMVRHNSRHYQAPGSAESANSRYTKTQTQWQRPPPIEPGRPIIKGVLSAVMGDNNSYSPGLSVAPTSAPAFEEEIIDPFNYSRPPSASEPPKYVPTPEPVPTRAGPKQIATMTGMRSVSPARQVQGTSPPSAVLAAAHASQRKPSPQRVPSTPPVAEPPVAPRTTVAPAPVGAVVTPLATVVPIKATPVVVKPLAKSSGGGPTSILTSAIAAQKAPASTATAAALRDRSMSDAAHARPNNVVPLSPRGGATGPTTTSSTRAASATITVAPRVPPSPSTPAPTTPISPRGTGSVQQAQPSWERKGVNRPASERKATDH